MSTDLQAEVVAWPADESPRAGDEKIVNILIPIQQKHKIPAMGAAVVRSSGIESQGVVGWRKLGDPTAVTLDDQWHLGSDTKMMTATLAAHYVELKKISWDTPVTKILPFVPPTWSTVTLDMCLAHRSGAPANISWMLQVNRSMAVKTITANPPQHDPGTKYLYSNAGYVLAGAMLEKITNKSWEELIQDDVWKPLKIKNAGFGGMGTTGQVDQPWAHKPGGIVVGNGPLIDNAAVLGPAGTVHMPLAEWAKFIADQLNGAQGKPALLKADSYQHLQTPWPNDTCARGWIVVPRPWAQGNAYTHSGSNTMHFAVVWMAQKIDLAILICCNQGEAAQACDEVASELIKAFIK